jgi:hypothetical protein
MKAIPSFPSSLLVVAFAVSGLPASGDDTPSAAPIVQVKFDCLIPTSYPTVTSDFNQLNQIRFDRLVPTSFPASKPTLSPSSQAVSYGLIPWSYPTQQMNFNRLTQVTFLPLAPTPPSAIQPRRNGPAIR